MDNSDGPLAPVVVLVDDTVSAMVRCQKILTNKTPFEVIQAFNQYDLPRVILELRQEARSIIGCIVDLGYEDHGGYDEGIKIVQMIQKTWKYPVVVWTKYPLDLVKKIAQEAGAFAVLNKFDPKSEEELVQVLVVLAKQGRSDDEDIA